MLLLFVFWGIMVGLVATTNAVPYSIPFNDVYGHLEVHGHRGAQGMRTEGSLWAFAYAMELGVETLEMDVVFTKDEVPVVWHDHYIYETKCKGAYVGHYVANLTLAELQTLDCGLQLVEHPESQIHPETRIATLEEVLDLITCYGDEGVTINIETKLDPTARNETLGVEKYINDIVPVLQARGFAERAFIQSFDWRTLFGIHAKFPSIKLVALLDDLTTTPAEDGSFPWLGGVQLDRDFDNDWIAAAASTGSKILSPLHGNGESINDLEYEPFTTREVVQRAHAAGMKVFAWTVDAEVTISKMIDDGVDGIISNYPERVLWVGKQRGLSVGRARRESKPECLSTASS